MKLKKMTLTNFQGIRSFTLDTDGGKDVSVLADNAVGKTTIYNAFLWLLFEKNSLGAKDFDIKTRDESGQVVPAINHEVEAVFAMSDGQEVTMKRAFLEKYTKKRGYAEAEFTGHVTEHFINGVPKSKGEYQEYVESIAPEKLFMALTSPTYFNEQLSWQDRRKMLTGLCLDIQDDDILADERFADLRPVLAQHSPEDAKKVETSTRKKINDELSGIPGRIDEASRAIPETATGNLESLASKAKKIADELALLREEKIRLLSGGQVAEKQKELAEIDLAITHLKNNHAASVPDVTAERKQVSDIATRLQTLEMRIDADKREISRLEAAIEQFKAYSRDIASKWENARSAQFVPGGHCPTCGQDYPENLQAVQEADFNRNKSEQLESIVAKGKRNEAEWKEATDKLAEKQDDVINCQLAIDDLMGQSATIQGQINKKCTLPEVTSLPEYAELTNQWNAVNDEILKLNSDSGASHAEASQRVESKQAELDAINLQITAIESAGIQRQRIDELKAREKDLAKQFERSEKILFLIEQFIRAKVSMREEAINGKFETVRWKLFDVAINGGVSETCTCTVDGVPYGSINNAARIQGGLDIIKALSWHYGIDVPVWVDNRESVTMLPAMPCQLISLVVSSGDKSLRVEVQ